MIMEAVQREIDALPQDLYIPCDLKGCRYTGKFETIEMLQEHKHEYHKLCYLYECEECRTEYVSEWVGGGSVILAGF